MSINHCASHPDFASPDPDCTCCYGAAFTGGERCTCWAPVIAPHPTTQCEQGPMTARSQRCHDCAYRRDSPERHAMGGDRMPYDPNGIFICHDGLPKAVFNVHPNGAVMAPAGDSYQPLMNGTVAWLADGRPATVCAGWAADNRLYWQVER